MTVEAIPGEPGRFFVSSRSRPEMWHMVDLAFVQEGFSGSCCACGCEEYQCKGHVCAHILATVKHEQERLKKI